MNSGSLKVIGISPKTWFYHSDGTGKNKLIIYLI